MSNVLLDHLGDPLPDTFDAVARVFHQAANAKKDGTPRKRERVSIEKVRALLLGEHTLTGDERVLLAAARRHVLLQSRARILRRDVLDRLPTPAWVTAAPIRWRPKVVGVGGRTKRRPVGSGFSDPTPTNQRRAA